MIRKTRANVWVEGLENRRLLTTYYVSPTGNDASAAGDALHPWQTLAKLDATSFHAGDSILFQSGQSFAGGLTFGADDGGTSASPITISTYSVDPSTGAVSVGAGTATINAGKGNGIFAQNTSGFSIANLTVIGTGQAANSFNGIQFDNGLAGNIQLPDVHINNVSVSGFGKFGIDIGGSNGKSGFTDVRITNSNIFNDIVGGINTYGVFNAKSTLYANSNVYIAYCTVHDNPGYAKSPNHVGDGIVVSDVNGSTIERCESYNNGAKNTHVGGPVGIWAWDSNAVTIQYNESYSNHTNSTADGGGFDLDGGCTNCVLQYNYSHDNDGPGYGLFQYTGARPWNNNVVRYNVSVNDARKNSNGAISIWNGGSGVANAEIYNNTIYLGPTTNGTTPHAIFIETASTNIHFRNNIIQTAGSATVASITGTQVGLLFQDNDYWTSGSAFLVTVGKKKYTTLGSWRTASGVETLNGVAVGYSVNPLLTSPGSDPVIGNPDNLATLSAYQLQSISPLINEGLNLATLFGINPGTTDFYGNPIPDASGKFDIGANEYT